MKLSLNSFLTPAILAGGIGSRLGKITKTTPKPLLKVNGEYFINYILEKIYLTGFKEVYIKTYRSRWGCCSSDSEIFLNWKLILMHKENLL